METQIVVRALGELLPEETLNDALRQHRRELLRLLQGLGFGQIEFTAETRSFATRFAENTQLHRPELTAVYEGRKVGICFGPAAEHPMELDALSEAQCACCDEHYPEHDIYYAALVAAPDKDGAKKLLLLGPVQVRAGKHWYSNTPSLNQFLPYYRRTVRDRYSPIFGGCVLFKLERYLIPHIMEHGQLPRFAVKGVFDNQKQGGNGLYGLMDGAPPTHFMLIEAVKEGHEFRRPFFFYGERPQAELELIRCGESGATMELLDKTGRTLYAESLEVALFPGQLPVGKHYMCTLSLVADRCRILKREFKLGEGPLLDQARRDYMRERGEEPPADFSVQVKTEGLRTIFQEPGHSYMELCGRVTRAEHTTVDGQPAMLLSVLAIPQNDSVEVQIFVGAPLGLEKLPEEGDMVECAGYLYASPDEVLPGSDSWQDSGEVAALQASRERSGNILQAYERYASYSLAQSVAAAAFVGAGYSIRQAPGKPTREAATFLVQSPTGEQKLIFVDTIIGDAAPDFAYTPEQQQSITEKARAEHGDALQPHHCIVHLLRDKDTENYSVRLEITPPCADIEESSVISDATQFPLPGKALDEAEACRIICNAICSQEWGPFARAAAEDMSYISRVNGTRTLGKISYIRYMAERKQLWVEQQGWAGMSMDTGTILYEGSRRPCFMITCYGHMIGAAVVTLRHGLIAHMETVPLEANDSFEKDAECAEEPTIFHPYRGHLTPHPALQTPLQRYAGAFLQECMLRKTGLIGAPQNTTNKGARWLKIARNEPSFCDLAFTHAGHLFAVSATEVETHPDHGGSIADIIEALPDRKQLIAKAEAYGLIPCVFPAEKNHTPDIETTWNLWDIRTNQPVHPEDMPPAETATATEWEILCAALVEYNDRISRAGGKVLAYHDTPELLPHLWYRDAAGKLSWLIIRPHAGTAPADSTPTEAERRAVRLTPGISGYVADVVAYGNASGTAPGAKGKPLHLRLSEPLPLEEA